VLGDNRDNALDSRYVGPIPSGFSKGRVISIWWSSRQGPDGGIQWGRIGRL
jgi:type IV secretory pathway protease TraF